MIVHAQSFTTKIYTTADGLSDNYIFCIYQDSYGYLWIGTFNGLNRFDGRRFVNYGLKNGLPSASVDRVYEDSHHRLWIGTRKGMAELRGDSCFIYPVSDKKDINFVSGFIETVPGKLWALTDHGAYEFINERWIKISLAPGRDNDGIGKIVQTSHGLFINYRNTSVIQKTSDGDYKTILSVESNRPYFNNLYEKNDNVYISTYHGLQYWNGTAWIKRYDDTLSKKYIFTSFCDNSNRFWFGTRQDGVFGIIETGKEINYQHIPLSFNLISNFYDDRDQNIWVAGFQGLLKISPSPYHQVALPAKEKIVSIQKCIVMPSGKMAISAENGKLLVIKHPLPGDTTIDVITSFQLSKAGDFIDFYTFDERQQLWFTTREGGLYRMSGQSLTDFTSLVHFKNELFRGLAYDKKTKRLFVCADSVLLTGDATRLDTFFSSKREFISMPAIVYVNEKDGSLLVQTLENGVFLINAEQEMHALGKENDFFKSIRSTGFDGEVEVWAAHGGFDISKYRWKNSDSHQIIEKISEKDGLTDNTILDLAIDKRERIWIASTKGVTLMQKNSDNKWIHQDIEINESGKPLPLSFASFAEGADGNMWMGLSGKLIVFGNDDTAISGHQTNTVIEKVLLFNRPANWSQFSDSLDGYLGTPINPLIRYNQNTLSIVFNGVCLSSNLFPEFSYRLMPSDTIWSNSTASNVVSFYQLAPGDYHFEVRSRIKGRDWSRPAMISFTIKKPFWDTWWFRIAIVLIASAIIVLIFRYRLNRLKEKTLMQNQILELEMKALKTQMNPHFIHNALNSIQSLIINNRTSEASAYISKFAKLLRQVLENADKNLISLDKELYSLQLYVALEKLRMSMDVDYSEHVDENIIASETKIPPLILQPFVENALWHGLSNKEGNKKITLTIREEEGWIICEITDNGIGRKKAGESGRPFPEGSLSKAVNITTQRLANFNQTPRTNPVSFIDLENNNEAAGTTVIVRIRTPYAD